MIQLVSRKVRVSFACLQGISVWIGGLVSTCGIGEALCFLCLKGTEFGSLSFDFFVSVKQGRSRRS